VADHRWNLVEGAIAVTSGVVAGSLALVGFGLDSFVEVFAGGVVLWQLRGVPEDRERRALGLIALSFFALAVYVVAEAVRDLVAGTGRANRQWGSCSPRSHWWLCRCWRGRNVSSADGSATR
jgi:hypothetical protein